MLGKIIKKMVGVHVHEFKLIGASIVYAPPISAGPYAKGIWEETYRCECGATKTRRVKQFI